MNSFIIFLLGVIIGILVRDIKFTTIKYTDKIKKKNDKTQFLDSIPFEEKFNKANNITDII